MSEPTYLLPGRIVFYLPEPAHRNQAQSIIEIAHETTSHVELLFASSEARMLEICNSHTLVVSYASAKGRLGNLLYQSGIPFHVSLGQFKNLWPDLYQTKQTLMPGLFVLAYLPPNIERIASAVLTLYGYETISVHHFSELSKTLTHSTCPLHLVFDQDMPSLKNKQTGDNRENVFTFLKQYKRVNSRFSVSVIKDFDQGSLFEDLGSSVKDITPAMLSPEEFLSFLRSILFDFHYERIERLFKDHTAKLLNLSPYGRSKVPIFSHLNDLKRCFNFSESEQRNSIHCHRNNHFIEIQNLYKKDLLLGWMDDVFSRENPENKLERGALVFFERPDGVTVSLKSMPPISAPERQSDTPNGF